MQASSSQREYLSHVTLMFLGEALSPAEITRSLRMRPSKSWSRGELNRLGTAEHQYGGWKKQLPESQMSRPLASQLRFWVRALRGHAAAISALSSEGHVCALNCYVATAETASIILPTERQAELSNLGLELRLSFFTNPR